jgi:hypothetical protein
MDNFKDKKIIKGKGGIRMGGKALIETNEVSFPAGTASQDILVGTSLSTNIKMPPQLNNYFLETVEWQKKSKLEITECIFEGEVEGNIGEVLGVSMGNIKMKGKFHIKKTPTDIEITVIKRWEKD